MIHPPSPQLLHVLQELGLCTPADLRRCRARVRLLSRDLPAFDSVWIDALFQTRRITGFQAARLSEGRGAELRIGPFVLCDRLGGTDGATTYRARHRTGSEHVVVKRIPLRDGDPVRTAEQLSATIRRLAGTAIPGWVGPSAVRAEAEATPGAPRHLTVVSRDVPGLHLGELVVRRGRFPADVVAALARCLVDTLAAAEARGAIHGDLVRSNVRLPSDGRPVLVDAGLVPVLRPEVVFAADLSVDRCEGIAPERIGTGAPATVRSDMYALGCLLWHLLAGRPVFPTGDPLGRLAAHRTRTVPDVREFEPDVPPVLAELIARLAAVDPQRRPASFDAVRRHLGPPRSTDRRRLARFAAGFRTSAARLPTLAGTGRPLVGWPLAAALLFVLSGAVLTLIDTGARTVLLEIAGRVSTGIEERRGDWFGPNGAANGAPANPSSAPNETPGANEPAPPHAPYGRALPPPDEHGTILLEDDGPYAAAEIAAVGPLVLRGDSAHRPVVLIGTAPLKLWAERIVLENVHVRRVPVAPETTAEATSPAAPVLRAVSAGLVLAECQELVVAGCSFSGGPAGAERETGAALGWRPLDDRDPTGGSLALRDVVVRDESDALATAVMPRRLVLDNVLHVGGRFLVRAAHPPRAGRTLEATLANVTLRGTAGLLALGAADRTAKTGAIALDAEGCVFDLTAPDAALFHLVQNPSPAAAPPSGRAARGSGVETDSPGTWPQLALSGTGCLVPADLPVARLWSGAPPTSRAVEPDVVTLEGLAAATYRFAGPAHGSPADHALSAHEGPTGPRGAPGLDARRLRVPADGRDSAR